MTDLHTSEAHRLIQVFLSGNGVFEVYINVAYRNFACTCPGFRARMVCKHTRFVREKYEAGDGCYPANLRKGAKPAEPLNLTDAGKFREWIINNTQVEVL